MPLGNAYIDNSYLSCFVKDKILYGTILIGNPLNNYDLRNTIYHEIRHYYNALKTYQSNSHFIKKDFDLRQSNANYDFRDYDVIVKNLHSSNGADHLKDIIFSCFYYLNHDEMEARQENIFRELKSGKTITIDVYNNIFTRKRTLSQHFFLLLRVRYINIFILKCSYTKLRKIFLVPIN